MPRTPPVRIRAIHEKTMSLTLTRFSCAHNTLVWSGKCYEEASNATHSHHRPKCFSDLAGFAATHPPCSSLLPPPCSLQVEPSKLLPVEQWKAKVLKAPEPVKAAEPTAAAASPAAEAAAEPVAAVDAEEAEAAEEEAKDEAAEPAAEEGDAPAEGGDYSTMSYRELQAACKEKGMIACWGAGG